MAVKIATRGAQTLSVAVFKCDVTDTMIDTSGNSTAFGALSANVYDIINLDPKAVVVAASVTSSGITGSTTLLTKLGDSNNDDRYLSSADNQDTCRAATPDGLVTGSYGPLRLTVTPTVAAATAGSIRVEVQYYIDDRQTEVQPY